MRRLALVAAVLATTAAAEQTGLLDREPGVKLHWRKVGSGPRVLIVPGDFLFRGALDGLAKGRTLITYDMRGRGRSSAVAPEPAKVSIQQDVADLEAIRAHFKAEKFTAVGYSYLGMMVVLYATEHPERVERLVMLGPLARKTPTEYPPELRNTDPEPVVAAVQPEPDPKAFCEQDWLAIRPRLVGDPKNAEKLGRSDCQWENEWPARRGPHFAAKFESIVKLDLTQEAVAKVTAPALILHGRRDRNVPYGAGRQWARELPNALLITLPQAAHNSWIEEPKEVEWIDAFLSGEPPARAEKIAS